MAHEEWARGLSPAERELWALPDYDPGTKDLRKRAAAIAEIKRLEADRQRRITRRQLWITAIAALAAWGSATAAIVNAFRN